ncbi:uncharacterized protein G2W53_004444 [Senna tora]|uniref:Uncharacterized protein n=1 Tax=Senna tora TaxID=362788 RepID=A0A835CI30_9FABA|nr:uncharacterized protein G2W53_004444 [Senna tora]
MKISTTRRSRHSLSQKFLSTPKQSATFHSPASRHKCPKPPYSRKKQETTGENPPVSQLMALLTALIEESTSFRV